MSGNQFEGQIAQEGGLAFFRGKGKTMSGIGNNFKYILITIFIVFFLASPALSAQFCVSNASELITALTTATNNGENDIIRIQQGTYNGNFIYASTEAFGVTIEGGYTEGCVSRVIDATNTVLDAGDNGAVLVFSSPDVSPIYAADGLTLQNGQSSHGGGGLYIITNSGGKAKITNSSILYNNSSTLGGGFHISTGEDGDVEISLCNIIGNNGVGGGGGSIFRGKVNISHNNITNNDDQNGGGLRVTECNIVNLEKNTIQDNRTDQGGGGLYIEGGIINLTDNAISSNIANNDSGGGVYIYRGSPKLIGNVIKNNEIIGSSYGGGICIRESNEIYLISNYVTKNMGNDDGGGISIIGFTNCTMTNNVVTYNEGGNGGGIFLGSYPN